jgi:Ferritin-like
MKHPSRWNKSDLHNHLQQALNLELWTIPLYLTALYSIKNLRKLKHHDYPDAAKLILSVAIQEMLHMELVCNISNALGCTPEFLPPNYDEQLGIPFIHPAKDYLPPELNGYKVKPQALNEHSLRLFCAIELPHPKKEIGWNTEKSYTSIADLYAALKTGISSLWNECYVGDKNNRKQKNSFTEYNSTHGRDHGFSQIVDSPETAVKAIDAIIEQGEGADCKYVPADFRPHPVNEGKVFETSWYKGNLSHYQKFRILLHSHNKLPLVHKENKGVNNLMIQQHMKLLFLEFLSEMQINFNSEGAGLPDSFWNKMLLLGDAIAAVWESGMCPDFNFNIPVKQV